MNKVLKTISVLTVICIAFCNPTNASFEAEKEIIDQHNVGTFKANITGILNFVKESVTNGGDERFSSQPYDLALHNLKMLEKKPAEDLASMDESRIAAYDIIYGSFHSLQELAQKDDLQRIDLLRASAAASTLLSPEIFSSNFSYSYDYGIYKEALRYKGLYGSFGQLLREGKDVSEFLEFSSFGFELTCRYFTPLILTGDSAVYTEKGYLYALSKGMVLYGLENGFAGAHGGLFKLPIELFVHDQAHQNDVLMPGAEYSEEDHERVASVIKDFSGKIYNLLINEEVFALEDRAMAIRAAFYLFHESHIYESTKFFSGLSLKLLGKLFQRLDYTVQSGLNNVSGLKPDSTKTKMQLMMEKIMADQGGVEDTFNFTARFNSDFPWMIVDAYKGKRVCDVYKDLPFRKMCEEGDAKLMEGFDGKKASELLQEVYLDDSYADKSFTELLQTQEFGQKLGEKINTIKLGDLFTVEVLAECMGESIETFIYGTETDLDRTRVYHGRRTLVLTQLMIEWFKGKIEKHI